MAIVLMVVNVKNIGRDCEISGVQCT